MKFSFILFFAMLSISSIAQIDTLKVSASKGFDVESGTKTGTIEIQGKAFDVFSTEKGSQYVKATGNKGNIYPVWIGEPCGDIFYNGGVYQCRKTKKGKRFILLLVAGKPFCKYETVE